MSPGDNWNAIVPFQRHGVSLRPEVGFGMLYRQRVWLRGCQAETRAHPVVPLRTARIVLGARLLPLRRAGLVYVRGQHRRLEHKRWPAPIDSLFPVQCRVEVAGIEKVELPLETSHFNR